MLKQILSISISGLIAGTMMIGYMHWSNDNVSVELSQPLKSFLSLPVHASYKTPVEQQIINIYKQVSPSVVNITTRSVNYNYFFEAVPREGAGSGFVIDSSGHVVTNFHVVDGAQRYYVTFGNMAQSYPAKYVGGDETSDLAVLKVKAPSSLLNPVTLGNSSRLEIGQTAIAVGNPFGLGQTMTTGIISSLGRDVQTSRNRSMVDMIQTDASINRGNSGGPLFNSMGQVIGVNTLIISPSGGSIGLGFAIPINVAKRFIPELIRYGRAFYPWLGIRGLALTPAISKALKLKVVRGLLVTQTFEGASASLAGIRGGSKKVYLGNYLIALGGDIIVAIDRKPIKKNSDLTEYLATKKRVGDTVKITVIRNGRKLIIPVKLTPKKRVRRR